MAQIVRVALVRGFREGAHASPRPTVPCAHDNTGHPTLGRSALRDEDHSGALRWTPDRIARDVRDPVLPRGAGQSEPCRQSLDGLHFPRRGVGGCTARRRPRPAPARGGRTPPRPRSRDAVTHRSIDACSLPRVFVSVRPGPQSCRRPSDGSPGETPNLSDLPGESLDRSSRAPASRPCLPIRKEPRPRIRRSRRPASGPDRSSRALQRARSGPTAVALISRSDRGSPSRVLVLVGAQFAVRDDRVPFISDAPTPCTSRRQQLTVSTGLPPSTHSPDSRSRRRTLLAIRNS